MLLSFYFQANTLFQLQQNKQDICVRYAINGSCFSNILPFQHFEQDVVEAMKWLLSLPGRH
jgi:hypothetical protein